MKMNKQRKILIGTLCIGLGGLVVDRFVLGTPGMAAADDRDAVIVTPEPPAAVTPQRSDAEPEVIEALPTYASLTQRLIEAQDLISGDTERAGSDDPFSLPDQWQSDKSKPLRQQPAVVETPGQQISDVFKLVGTVRSLIAGKEEMLAVITGGGLDSRAIRAGQKIRIPSSNGLSEEYQLVEVGSRYVIWLSVRSGERISMQVEEDL